MVEPTLHLTEDECSAKAKECRELAARAAAREHRIMLDHMADRWERIRLEIQRAKHQSPN